ncbi:gp53-like domain-containing protein [Escherichia coli]
MQNLMPPINTPDQLFHDGDPTQGIEGTLVTAGYLNNQQGATRDLQQELLNVLGGAHIQPDPQKTDQLLTALRALLLSRKNPFGDIKLDGTVQKALENLGLGEAAKRDVGTGDNQIPDMGSFTLSVSGTGYQKLPSGFILQWGSIGAPGIAQDVVTHFPIAFPNRCLRVLVSQDYTPDSGAVGYIACAGFSPDPVKFISRASTPGLGASFLALGC